MACHLWQALGLGGTALYAIRVLGCVMQFTHGEAFHRPYHARLLIPVQAAHHNEMMSPAVTE
jgi:hypothetical protein